MDMTRPADLEPTPGSSGPGEAPTAVARLLEYERGHWVALAQHATLEVLDDATVVEVPGSAYYCTGLTRWQGNWLPVIDLQVLLHAYRKEYALPSRYLLVVAYQTAAGEPLCHGAISLPSLPATVAVSDSAQCALPGDCDLWSQLALSCFEHEGRAVPILDTARLFAGYHG
jgi:CheW-like domain